MPRTVLFRQLLLALQHARRQNLQAAGKPAPLTKAQAGWTRRRFMKTAGLMGAAGAVSGGLPLPVQALTATGFEPAHQVAIVGGGMAGLNAAYQLEKAGISGMVYEARRRVGGRILSLTGAIGEELVTDLDGAPAPVRSGCRWRDSCGRCADRSTSPEQQVLHRDPAGVGIFACRHWQVPRGPSAEFTTATP